MYARQWLITLAFCCNTVQQNTYKRFKYSPISGFWDKWRLKAKMTFQPGRKTSMAPGIPNSEMYFISVCNKQNYNSNLLKANYLLQMLKSLVLQPTRTSLSLKENTLGLVTNVWRYNLVLVLRNARLRKARAKFEVW